MYKTLLSVGLDVGTTTTHLVVSRLTAENRAGGFAVPKMEIKDRQILYESPVYETPLLGHDRVDGNGIRQIVEREYAAAGIRPEQVDTGAVIITGETSRKENAASVLTALAEFAGQFVVATAGPDLESILAARGAGADILSRDSGVPVLHMDIGGGTSNLTLCKDGKIEKTGCLNVGGRLVRMDERGTVVYLSEVLRELVPFREGDVLTREQGLETARLLASALEMAAGLRPAGALLEQLTTKEAGTWMPVQGVCISFSGGVADCIGKALPWLSYRDLGPLLGQAIRESRLCEGNYRLGNQTIRATVIGAGCYSMQLSGSTVFLRNAKLPAHNLPAVSLTLQEQQMSGAQLSELIRRRLEAMDTWGVLSLPGWNSPDYSRITALADAVADAVGDRPCFVALEQDMAKALGYALALRLPQEVPCVCIDGVSIHEGSFLDIGAPVGPAIAVTVKTLIFGQ